MEAIGMLRSPDGMLRSPVFDVDAAVQGRALTALFVLSCSSHDHRLFLYNNGVVDLMIQIMSRHAANADIQAQACGMIYSIAIAPLARREMHEREMHERAVKGLVQAIVRHQSCAKVVAMAMMALKVLTLPVQQPFKDDSAWAKAVVSTIQGQLDKNDLVGIVLQLQHGNPGLFDEQTAQQFVDACLSA
eukprot:Tamp_23745.p1 GENE.Tamp_23745~~Tamp_23745.p1  ORF type:complete len:214 (-),score=33.59 Tamp_23745:379-945(-)